MKDEKKAPKLRFKGFTDDWEQCKLEDVADIVGGGTPSTKKAEYWNGNINWFSPAEIGNQIFVNRSRKRITELGLMKSSAKILPVGTILFTSRAGIGNTAILTRNACTNQGFQSIVPNSHKLDSYFIYSESAKLKRYGETVGSGSTFTEVSGKQMRKMPLHIPNITEQAKIGNMIKILDHTITLHEEKKHQLECLKSALLQKMFADKSSYPAVRFVGFKNAWEQCKLSDISEKSYEKNTDNKYSTVLTNSAEYGIVKQRDFFDKDIANSSNISGYYIVRKNYFVYNPRISNQAKFGPINRNKLDETGIMSPLYLVFTVHDIDESFLETLFQTTTWHRFMYQNGDTGARADRFAIKDSTFMSMPIKVPPLEEQHKLALAFQKLDHTITLHDHKLELLKRMKQSLLQKMFI